MGAVLLNESGRNLRQHLVAEEGKEMRAQPHLGVFRVVRIPFGRYEGQVFGQEMLCRFAERFPVLSWPPRALPLSSKNQSSRRITGSLMRSKDFLRRTLRRVSDRDRASGSLHRSEYQPVADHKAPGESGKLAIAQDRWRDE